MEIRRATYEEAKQIKEFDVFVGDRRIDNWRGELLVCAEANCILGFVAYSSNLFYNRPFISLLIVRKEHRRRGVATALVRRFLDMYEGLEVWASTELGNDPAMQFFQKLGFEQKGQIHGLDGEGSTELYLRRAANPPV